jgi:hypothetical protein
MSEKSDSEFWRNSVARVLNGMGYGEPIPEFQLLAAVDHRLVILIGASDDLAEFYGAFRDEVGAHDGAEIRIDAKGLLPDRESIESDDDEALRDYFSRIDNAATITAHWDREGFSWVYSTDIPHDTFNVIEDGDTYCRGIVFSLDDLAPKVEIEAECSCPQHGRWYRAEDVDNTVRMMDIVMNGEEGAARQAALIDLAADIAHFRRVPDNHVIVPAELTAENGAKHALIGEFNERVEMSDGHVSTVSVSWTTIKEIWKAAVQHFTVCDIPPPGWKCSRPKGHSGPCAASEL